MQPRSLVSLHPKLLPGAPKCSEIIEICYEKDTPINLLLTEIVCNAILQEEFGGKNASVVLICSDGRFNIDLLITNIQIALHRYRITQLRDYVEECLQRLHIITVYDSRQLYIAMQSLENLLSINEDISLVIIESIKAFYWSDRMFGSKVIKMETYVTNILTILKNVTRDFQTVILYTKNKNTNNRSDVKSDYRKNSSVKIDHELCLLNFEDLFLVKIDNLGCQREQKFVVENNQINWL